MKRKRQLSAAEAAKIMKVGAPAIYAAIKRGRLPHSKKVDGRWIVMRKDCDAWWAQIREWGREMARAKRKRRLTDEEFLQRLWDSDPD